MNERNLEQHYDARDRYVRALGVPDNDLLAPLVNPSFLGGPRWPSLRQSWRRVKRDSHTIVVSDGLSDPFDDEPKTNVGFGVEILVETADPVPDPVQQSWLFELAYEASQQAADNGQFRALRDDLQLFSMELFLGEAFDTIMSREGSVGVLFGVAPPDLPIEWQLPTGLVRVITVKLLYPSELAFVLANGKAGRQRLSELFVVDGTYHSSSMRRKPVL